MFHLVVEYSLGQEVTVTEIKTYLEKLLRDETANYVGFTSPSHERYLSGPAIVGHLILDHPQMISAETVQGYFTEENPSFKISHIAKL